RKSGVNIYQGTLGEKISVPNTSHHNVHKILLSYNFPPNLHEYDIIILDLDHYETIKYKADQHVLKTHTGKSAIVLQSSYPETIFDPRPYCSSILNEEIQKMGGRQYMIIAFSTKSYSIEYEPVKITNNYEEALKIQKYNIYDFVDNCPTLEPKYGKEIIICNISEDFKSLLESHKNQVVYNQTFHHPVKWQGEKRILDKNFVPILKNSNGDIVSICEFRNNAVVMYLPQITNKTEFLSEFLSKIAPRISPELFPYSTTFSWKEEQSYWLPNHHELLEQKQTLKIEYESKLEKKDDAISTNKEKFLFLHQILTETNDSLVNALIQYFKWLGLGEIKNMDESASDSTILEEDIQIEMDDGLLIIECKGIGGTSTDSDCNQISKIKHRRCKERNRFDVFALYIVNHQRYLPPMKRNNPPFTKHQKKDALNDERGLVTTWQLFNLYFDVEDGIIKKEEARQQILEFGLIAFKPKKLALVDKPKEIFKDGKVCIVNIKNTKLKANQEIFIEKDNRFTKAQIIDIQIESKSVKTASNGEIGLELSKQIKKKSSLWVKASV
ncbi:hypothetical protein KAU11_07490, partial [Candidatus Babeliales bacterium]|nr:hypothetical protein [Candidatus Babeliales bacterium]